MATFTVVGVTKEGYTRELYMASERQVHLTMHCMKEGVELPYIGHYLDPKDFPEAERFLLVWKEK